MRRIEAVLFASASPVSREDLKKIVGQGASVELLLEDLEAELADRPYQVTKSSMGWILQTRKAYADVVRAASDVGEQELNLREFDAAVLAAIAYYQPITREGLRDIFGKDINRDLIRRLNSMGLIGTGPRSPRRGAPYTFITTESFLETFGMDSLHDLPDYEQLEDAGMLGKMGASPVHGDLDE
jgi:segregation and condensation protein B